MANEKQPAEDAADSVMRILYALAGIGLVLGLGYFLWWSVTSNDDGTNARKDNAPDGAPSEAKVLDLVRPLVVRRLEIKRGFTIRGFGPEVPATPEAPPKIEIVKWGTFVPAVPGIQGDSWPVRIRFYGTLQTRGSMDQPTRPETYDEAHDFSIRKNEFGEWGAHY